MQLSTNSLAFTENAFCVDDFSAIGAGSEGVSFLPDSESVPVRRAEQAMAASRSDACSYDIRNNEGAGSGAFAVCFYMAGRVVPISHHSHLFISLELPIFW
jgi:hypothetical protein